MNLKEMERNITKTADCNYLFYSRKEIGYFNRGKLTGEGEKRHANEHGNGAW